MDKKLSMRKISERVGRDKAIEMVMSAYNTELIASWLRHIEASQGGKMTRPERRDHLSSALERVTEVCGLTD
jgi:hypothetical protein